MSKRIHMRPSITVVKDALRQQLMTLDPRTSDVWRLLTAKALVTKRIRPLTCDGKVVHVVGIPLHWGFTGAAKKGYGPNTLSPFVGDANIETPEFKAFLVNIEPAVGEAVS